MLTALLLAAATATATFDPLRFFAGQTNGKGELKVILRRRVPVSVAGSGTVQPDGSLVLDQVIEEGAKAPRARRWHLRRMSPGRYVGTLTDARGPVTAEADGSRLHLSFATPSGFKVQQWLTLAPDGRSADNVLRATRLGITVATLRERIVKAD